MNESLFLIRKKKQKCWVNENEKNSTEIHRITATTACSNGRYP